MTWLKKHTANFYSQCGEDGILAEIIRRLDLRNLWCCEFGAWDGQRASNTFYLVQEHGAKVIMIEGDPIKFQDLVVTAARCPTITPVNAYVSADPTSPNHLDRILARTDISRYFDVLSIDIDGDDLDVWESITEYSARIVIIEINPRIEPGVMQRHRDVEYDPTHNLDLNSFFSTVAVGQTKGYVLVCHTSCNLIFVKHDLVAALGMEQRYIDDPVLLFDWKWVKKARQALRKKQREQQEQT
jgi:hypothetical protein